MTTRQRKPTNLSLHVAKPSDGEGEGSRLPFVGLVPPWTVGAITTALGVAVAGWFLVSAWVLIGWGTDMVGGVSAALAFATRAWLATNGTGLRVGPTLMTLIPLGPTVLTMLALAAGAYFAARSGRADPGELDDAPAPSRVVVHTAIATAATYLTIVVVLAIVFTQPQQVARGFGFTVITAGIAALVGASAGARWSPLSTLPRWVQGGVQAAGIGVGAVALTGVVAVGTAVWAHWDRIDALSAALDLDPVPAAIVVLGELAFLPNFVVWAGSFAVGGGITLGTGTAITLASTQVGLLPAFPIFGALPEAGAASPGQMLWLLGAITAGGAAGYWAVRAWWWGTSVPRIEWAALVGGGAGVASALGWVIIAWLSKGDLGMQRLVDIGPRLAETLGFSVSILGVTGAVVGAGYGLWVSRTEDSDDGRHADAPDDDEATIARVVRPDES